MKKKILSLAAGLALTVLSSATFAQSVSAPQSASAKKALTTFDKQFGNATTPAIQSSSDGSMVLQSKQDMRTMTSVFNKRGNWVYSIVVYPPVSLDKHILDVVNNGYSADGYNITGMEKIQQPGMETVFLVYIKNNTSYKTLRVSHNDIEVMQEYNNA
jgi:hypothetical protein